MLGSGFQKLGSEVQASQTRTVPKAERGIYKTCGTRSIACRCVRPGGEKP